MVYTQETLNSLPADVRSDPRDKPPLRVIDDARPLYFLPKDNFSEEVLIPAFKAADQADCMVGFFSARCWRRSPPVSQLTSIQPTKACG